MAFCFLATYFWVGKKKCNRLNGKDFKQTLNVSWQYCVRYLETNIQRANISGTDEVNRVIFFFLYAFRKVHVSEWINCQLSGCTLLKQANHREFISLYIRYPPENPVLLFIDIHCIDTYPCDKPAMRKETRH